MNFMSMLLDEVYAVLMKWERTVTVTDLCKARLVMHSEVCLGLSLGDCFHILQSRRET